MTIKLRRVPYVVQLITFFVLSYLPIVIYIPVAYLIDSAGNYSSKEFESEELVALIVAPLIETLVFQYVVFKLLNKYQQKYPYLIVTLSALLFGLLHFYSMNYFIFGVLSGYFLAFAFNFYIPNYTKAFWSTFLLHALRNGTALLIDETLQ